MPKRLYRTIYHVHAESDCPVHGGHYLSGMGYKKADIQPLITDVVEDLPFYYDSCPLEEVRGIFDGTQEQYVETVTRGGKEVESYTLSDLMPVYKLYVTKKRRIGEVKDANN